MDNRHPIEIGLRGRQAAARKIRRVDIEAANRDGLATPVAAMTGRARGLVNLLPDDDLNQDDSPGLVAAGLSALSRGDAESATEAYEKLVARWRAVQLLERCN